MEAAHAGLTRDLAVGVETCDGRAPSDCGDAVDLGLDALLTEDSAPSYAVERE